MESNKSIWKKKIFSNRKVEVEPDFGTAHMMQKISRAHKKKKRRFYNYKNIETFENIHDATPENAEGLTEELVDGSRSGDLKSNGTWVDSDGKVQKGFFDKIDGKYYVTDLSGNRQEYDGPMEDGIPLTPDFWEGLDSGDFGMGADDPRKRLLDLIDAAEKWIIEFNQNQARTLANSMQQAVSTTLRTQVRKDKDFLFLSSTKLLKVGMIIKGEGIPAGATIVNVNSLNKITMNVKASKTGNFDINYYESMASEKDVVIITKYICLIESVIIAYFCAYNLIYATCYIDPETKRTVYIPRFTSDNLKILTLNRTYGIIFRPMVYFFTYALYFSDIMQYFLYDMFPNIFKKYLNVPFYFLALFFAMVYLLQNTLTFFLQFLRDVILFNTKNQIVNIMYSLVIWWYISDFDMISKTAKYLFGAAGSVFVKVSPKEEEEVTPKEETQKEEKKKAHKHKKHESNCSQCGMISLNVCGSCGVNVCGQCNTTHNCNKKRKPDPDDDTTFNFPSFDISGITKWFGSFFNWFDRVSVGGNMTPLYLLMYQALNMFNTASSFPLAVIYTIFQFIIVLAISVPLGALSCVAILFLMCTSMLWHPFSTLSVQKVMTMWSIPLELNQYIQMSFLLNFDAKDPDLSPKQIGEMIYAVGFDYIFTYILFIAITVVLVLAMVDFDKNISNPKLKTNISMLFGTIMALNTIPLIVSFFTKLRQDRQMTPEVEKFINDAAEQVGENVVTTKLVPPIGPALSNMKESVSSMVPKVDLSKTADMANKKLKAGVGAVMNNPLTKMATGAISKMMNPFGPKEDDDDELDESDSESESESDSDADSDSESDLVSDSESYSSEESNSNKKQNEDGGDKQSNHDDDTKESDDMQSNHDDAKESDDKQSNHDDAKESDAEQSDHDDDDAKESDNEESDHDDDAKESDDEEKNSDSENKK